MNESYESPVACAFNYQLLLIGELEECVDVGVQRRLFATLTEVRSGLEAVEAEGSLARLVQATRLSVVTGLSGVIVEDVGVAV